MNIFIHKTSKNSTSRVTLFFFDKVFVAKKLHWSFDWLRELSFTKFFLLRLSTLYGGITSRSCWSFATHFSSSFAKKTTNYHSFTSIITQQCLLSGGSELNGFHQDQVSLSLLLLFSLGGTPGNQFFTLPISYTLNLFCIKFETMRHRLLLRGYFLTLWLMIKWNWFPETWPCRSWIYCFTFI